MAVIGYLGEAANTGVIFEVSDETVETVRNMVWSGSARYAVHQRHMNHALTEFTGLDPDKISFDITLAADLGVEPMEELVKLWTFKRRVRPCSCCWGNTAMASTAGTSPA